VYRGAVVVVSIDGVVVAPEHARISVFDRGLLHGDGCFEVLRTWDGVARDLEAHLDRLFDTARFLSLRTIDRGKLTDAIIRTISAAGVNPAASISGVAAGQGEHRIRILMTRGEGALDQRLGDLGPGRAIVIVEPLPPPPVELSIAVVDWPLPDRDQRGHKTLAYLDAVIARELARVAGADEAVRLDGAGHVIEGATCNVFTVSRGVVATPPADRGMLPGIVRGHVLALCARDGIPNRVRELSLRDLRSADEVFVTSSLRGVVPVTRIDLVPVAKGPMTETIAAAYVAAMRSAT
jgi:branched-chain amino acid aminotransferase